VIREKQVKREYQQGKDHPSRNRVQRIAAFCMLSCMALLYAGKSAAKPDMKPLGPNIADRGSAVYHFSVHQFDSADGKRHYRVWTGVPDRSPPPSGYPVLYMLDGNALMDRLSEDLLKQLTQKTPPVIVAIGYQTPLPFDTHARAYDFTRAKGAAARRSASCWKGASRQRSKKTLTSTPINGASGDTPSAGCSCWTAG